MSRSDEPIWSDKKILDIQWLEQRLINPVDPA
jgi:hypothetical protein